MSQIQNTEEIKGKKIARVYQAFDELWLRFTDGDFVWFRASTSYGDTELELVSTAPCLDGNTQAFLALELATPQEVETLQKEVKAKQQKDYERREKEQLAKLLAKYPQK
jgi:hypothetical protein